MKKEGKIFRKRGHLIAFLSILLISCIGIVKAQSYYFEQFVLTFDPLMLAFIILFGLLFYTLGKFFKDNKAIAFVLAFAVSLGIIYWTINLGWNFDGLFFSLGLNEDMTVIVVSLILLFAAIFGWIKWGFGAVLIGVPSIIFGLMILTNLGNMETTTLVTTLIIWGIIASIGLWMTRRKREGNPIGQGMVGNTARATGRGIGKGAAWTGRKTWQQTAGKLAANRQKQKAKRQIQQLASKMQADYDHFKNIYTNPATPKPTKKVAQKNMQNIFNQASSQGIRLRP